MSDDPFAPPAGGDPERAPTGSATTVILVWMICGTLVGLTLALTAQLTGSANPLASSLALGPIALGAVGGWLAFHLDRQVARDRPSLLDANGRSSRPVHALVYLLPMLVCAPTLVWLVMVVSVAMTSLRVGLLFGVGGFALGWAARRIVAQQALAEALQLLELGETALAKRQLVSIVDGYWATRGSRCNAHLNLGLVALTQGDLDRAVHHYRAVGTGVGGTFANAGLALVYALQDRVVDAETTLHAALTGPGATAVQGQTDTVRLLLTLREHGPRAARQLGDNLLTLEAGSLFRGLLAYAKLQEGDEEGARKLTDVETRSSLEDSWRTVVPEIAELAVAIG